MSVEDGLQKLDEHFLGSPGDWYSPSLSFGPQDGPLIKLVHGYFTDSEEDSK